MLKLRGGMALPLVLMAVGMLVLIAGSLATLAGGSMSAARHDQSSETAVYAAEAGLANATAVLTETKNLPAPFQGQVGEGNYTVTLTRNDTTNPMAVPGGPSIPAGMQLLRSVGQSRDKTTRESWALFRSGGGSFQVGALADNFYGVDSNFSAYDSATGTASASSTILATNTATDSAGKPITLTRTGMTGNVYIGPGGDPLSLIADDPPLPDAQKGTLANILSVPAIEVPAVKAGTSTGGAAAASPTPKLATWKNPIVSSSTIAPPSSPNGPVVITKNCLTCKLWPNGDFWANEGGSGSTIKGNLNTATSTVLSGSAFAVSFNPFNLRGKYHRVILDETTGKFGSDPYGIVSPAPAPVYTDAPSWLFGYLDGAPASNSPSVLQPGRYDNVTISGSATKLVEDGVYVIKNLTITGGGSLEIPTNAGNNSVYVTENLSMDGLDCIVNQTEKPPLLRLFYTGSNPVTLGGGSKAYACLLAPNADVNLEGLGSEFFGALVGKNVTVNSANFHFDLATKGVAVGTDANALTLVARYRP